MFFFPSCKVKKDYPLASKRLQEYVEKRFGCKPIGCCRVHHQSLKSDDCALVVCNNCSAILEESSNVGQIEFLWQVIDKDQDFPFPNYHHEPMTIQDCWVAFEKRALQDTVRSLLRKMQIDLKELPENYEKTKFCGVNLLAPCNPSNAKLAPRRYTIEGAHMFTPMEKERQQAKFVAHCQEISTERVACYCKFCTDAINMGGKKGSHLLELLFPAN